MADNLEKLAPQTAPAEVEKIEQEELEVVPIQQEAVEGAYHVHLSWRSWVQMNP